MSNIDQIRKSASTILVAGNHVRMIQSILDFDYAAGRGAPSVVAIISAGRKSQKFFWGDGEILIPVYKDVAAVKEANLTADWMFCITSPASTPIMINAFFTAFPSAVGAHLFAEGVAERDSLTMIETYAAEKLVIGPSGVGLCIPGSLKLGAIGGVLGERIADLGARRGHTAVICSSGGMVNELMYQVVAAGSHISFAACYGGDRFPITSPLQLLLEAEHDPETEAIVYFGELGGSDEYVVRDAIKAGHITKPMYAYIAGRYEATDEAIQFGHAKALAKAESETAAAKMAALRAVGVQVAETFDEYMDLFKELPHNVVELEQARSWRTRPLHMKHTVFSAPLYTGTHAPTFTAAILQRILDKEAVSREIIEFVDMVFAELLDHGPHVSGAVNAMVTTRAGRDLSSAVAAGVLTVGDRFGGAINGAASIWHQAVSHGTTADELVADYSKRREYILGIGHRKYSIYKPDPRVSALIKHGKGALKDTPQLDFALAVEAITSKKRANLILNIDGAVSALFTDYLLQKEGFTESQITELLEIEFYNALFIIPRTVGFVGNYLDQKRLDEGLFRLSEQDSFNF